MKSVWAFSFSQVLSTGAAIVVALAGTTAPLQATSCTPAPTGLVSWWSAEGNAADAVGANPGILQNGASFAPGEVGQAFALTTSNADIMIPASRTLDVGSSNGFTLEAWINPADFSIRGEIAEWNSGDTNQATPNGVHLVILAPGELGLGAGNLFADVHGADGQTHWLTAPGGTLTTNVFQHVALTYDKSSGLAVIYCNGLIAAQQYLGSFTPLTSTDFYLGRRPAGTGSNHSFPGLIDELSLYNRALATNEIHALYAAGAAGKCPSTVATNTCTPAPGGVVAWWPGEGNAADAVGAHPGFLQNGASFAPGEVGQAFTLTTTNAGIMIPASSALDVGTSNGFTLEAWINPADVTQTHPLFEWDNATGWGVHFHISPGQPSNGTPGPGQLYANIVDTGGGWHQFGSSAGAVTSNVFQHVALTYDKASGLATIYCNGQIVSQSNFGSFTPLTSYDLYLGRRKASSASDSYDFVGLIDEPAIYNRALTTNEIQAIFAAGAAGKCPLPLVATTNLVPAIATFTPTSGTNGAVVTLTGTNFSATAAANIVYFGAVRASVLTASPTSLTVAVPTGATYAPITVTVNGLVAYSAAAFEPTFAGAGAVIDSTTFAPGVNLAISNVIVTVIADLDGDGKPDLVTANVYANSITISQNITSNGVLNAASFATPLILHVGNGSEDPYSVTVADVDGDGKLDLVVPDSYNNQIVVYRNISSPGLLTTNSFAEPVSFPVGTLPRRVVVCDLDGDGHPDLVSVNSTSGNLSILRNAGQAGTITTNSFTAHVDLPTVGDCEGVAAGDLDGDGRPDLAVADTTGFISLYRNLCTPGIITTNSFAARVDLPAQSSLHVAIGDLDGDGKPELIISSYGPQTLSVYRNLATPGALTTNSFAAPVIYSLAGRGHSAEIADLNGDGRPDLAEVTELDSALSLFQNIGTGSFTNTSLAGRVDFATGWNAWGVALGDLDGDGRPDAVFGNTYDNTLTIYKNISRLAAAPIIVGQPITYIAASGSTATFAITATGASPLGYQWLFNGTNLNGATNVSLTLTNVQLNQAGPYSVLVSNSYGTVTSSNALLIVTTPILTNTPAPADMVSWWRAENNALDSLGTNHGTLMGSASYAPGEVGQGFQFTNDGDYVLIPASATLNIGSADGLTLEAWIKPATLSVEQPIFDWLKDSGDAGIHLYIATPSSPAGLYANLMDTNNQSHICVSPGGILQTGVFQHVAVSYSKTTGLCKLYCNGVLVTTNNLGIFEPKTTTGLTLARRVANGEQFFGVIDEAAIYKRALSDAEILAIYSAGTAGKYTPPTPPTGCTPPPSGLISWWPGEGNANDLTGANSGILSSNGATYATGKVGQGFRFDGTNGYLQIPDSDSLKPTNVTLEAWVWLDPGTTPGQGGESIFFKRNTWTYLFEGYSLLKSTIDNGNGTYSDRFQTVVSRNGTQVVINSTTVAQRGVWYHVAASYDGSRLTLYVNGVAEASAVAGFALDYGTLPVYIGTTGEPAPYNSKFGGIIDEPSIYNRALAASEIAAIYTAGSAGKCSATPPTNTCTTAPAGLVAWWQAEGSGADSVGTNNGSLNNGVGFATGAVGQSFTFNGSNSFVRIPSSPALQPTGSFTLEAWVNYDLQTSAIGGMIAMKGPDSEVPADWALSISGAHKLRPHVNLDGSWYYFDCNTALQPGAWYHVALVYDGAKLQGFVNGVLDGTLAASGTVRTSDNPMKIGAYASGIAPALTSFFAGRIDELSLYNRALTTNEIAAIYTAGSAGKCSATPPTNTCTPAPTGLVSWWPAENSAADAVGDNNGVLQNGATFAPGEVGQAFALTTTNADIMIPASSALDVGTSNGFTLEAWINPADVTQTHPLFEWNNATGWGVHFHIAPGQPSNGTPGPGQLYANIVDTGGGWHQLGSSAGAVTSNVFQHVALTYDKTSGLASIYCNGQIVSQSNFGSFTPLTSYDLYLGRRASGAVGDTYGYAGLIDEPAVYNRALTTNEIQAIFAAGAAGKCPAVAVAPSLIQQPVSQTVMLGNPVVFSVVAKGSQPLRFFWQRNGVLIPNATNASYVLDSAQLADSGSKFSCLVTNAYGLATSTNASLKVLDTVANDLCSGAIVITNASYTNTQSTLKATSFTDPEPACVDSFGNGVWYQFTARNAGVLQVDTIGSDFDTGLAIYTGSCGALTEVACNDDTAGVTSQITLATTAGTTYAILAGGFSARAGNLVLHLNHLTPPVFEVQPADSAVVISSNATFAPVLSGVLPMKFQWYFNDAPLADGGRISGATNAVLNVANVQLADGGNYRLVASNSLGATSSSKALLTPVILPPVITQEPASQIVLVGSNATFTVAVAGTPPYGYQWYFNGNALADDDRISGSLTPSLSISNVLTTDVGSYTLVVTNLSGTDTSTAATLTLLTPPSITQSPVGRSVPPGLPTTFAAAASANPAPVYQWQFNGTNIPGATASSYTVPAVGTNNLGFYRLVASNWVGVATSTPAQLTFGPVAAWGRNNGGECLPPPGLTNVIGIAGNTFASFAIQGNGHIVAWGSGSDTNVPASASNVVALATYAGYGNYALRSDGRVVGWNGPLPQTQTNIVSLASGYGFFYALRAEGTLTSWGNTLTPGFPAGLNHLTAVACGYNNAIALRDNGTIIMAGAGVVTNAPKGLSNVVAVAVGYTYAMALKADGTVVAWGSGIVTNLPAGLTNVVAISAANSPGQNLGLAVRADGSTVVWGDNVYGERIPPAALSNLVTVAGSAAPYHCLALVNDGTPQILHQPVGLTAYVGRTVTLHGDAVGTKPLSYQWLLNGTKLPGATSPNLVLANLQTNDAGSYRLLATNTLGSALSLAAPLTVIDDYRLTFLGQTTSGSTNYQGSTVNIDGLTILGNGPLRYQWFYMPSNNVKIAAAVIGATNDTLTLDPALAMQSGYYYATVSNLVQLSTGGPAPGLTSTPVNIRILFARSWGYESLALPGATGIPPVNVTNAVAIATGSGSGSIAANYYAVGADGKLSAWANYFTSYGETNVAAFSNVFVTAVAAGPQHSLALKSDGTVSAWGYGYYGQTNPPANLSGVTAIACGTYHDLALKSDGTVAGWGANQPYNYGQATNNPAATNVVAIAAGNMHSLALRADGSVVAWGANSYGQTIVPVTITNKTVAIAAGLNHCLALLTNGTVVQWGSSMGNYPVPIGLSNVVAIAAGTTHSTALKNDGTVVSWGYEYNGPAATNVPADLANVVALSTSGDHDLALFGTRLPAFTVQPWNQTVATTASRVWFAGKCAGVQPITYQWRCNGTNLPNATNDVLTVLAGQQPTGYYPPFSAAVYQLVASNTYGVVLSKPVKLSVVYPLSLALDTPTNYLTGLPLYNWTTSGSAAWLGETNVTHDGVDAARSGAIGASQETILQTTVGTNRAGSYSFWWKVSSEAFFDLLEFRVNGVAVTNLSGEVGWQQVTIPVAAGTNVLQWRYSKDGSFDAGQDAAWVDQFAYQLLTPPIITALSPSQTVNAGASVTLSVTATGQPTLSYRWRQNGTVVGTAATLSLTNVSRAHSGLYSVTVTNDGGATISGNIALKVLVPQMLGTPKLLPDGTFQLSSSDVDGSQITPADLANFEVQFTTNLVDWVTLPDGLSLTNGTLQLQDGGRTNSAARFYRIIEH